MTKLFQLLFPTRISGYGKQLFFITDEDNYISRLIRTGQIYNKIVEYPIISERV